MDADDICAPTRLQRQVEALHAEPGIGLVASAADLAAATSHPAGLAAWIDWNNTLQTPEQIWRQRFVETPVIHPTVCFRRELVTRHGAWRDGDFPEDYELWLRWLEAGVRMRKLPDALVTWRDSPTRLTRTDARYRTEALYALKAIYLARWLQRAVPPKRPLWYWGAGRITRLRQKPLIDAGHPPAAYIDIDPRKTGKVLPLGPIHTPEDLARAELRPYVLAWVGIRGARARIATWLDDHGFAEERDYLLVA